MSDAHEPIALPTPSPPPVRPPVPIVAAIVPVLGAGVLWMVTGSALTLLFALIGPLVALASLVDGLRSGRRQRRRAERDAARDRERAAGRISARHDAERAALRRRHPDAAALLARDGDVWRPVRERDDRLVVGSGEVPSALRVTGGDDTDPLRSVAATLGDAPLTVPLGDGVCVTGPAVLATAVARGLMLQLVLARSPFDLQVVGSPTLERTWVDRLPHRGGGAPLTVVLAGPGDPLGDADIVIAAVPTGAPTPMRCAAVLEVRSVDDARLVWGSSTVSLTVEAVARSQAEAVARRLAARAEAISPAPAPTTAGLSTLREPGRAAPEEQSLLTAFASTAGEAVPVDLVADGPHAIVTGVTGTGKSELLVSWVVALAARYSTRQVSFLLADFKGGTAFDPLRALPHVTGVISDLDSTGARRAIESLRAELRRREAHLADAGARDVADVADLPRLVIVVDEFAALLAEEPELQRVFVDIGARGRALGMHLVLGTQRATGVIRDSLLANCPLRVSLRAADATDSRLMIGTDAAARLPGGVAGRGRVHLRRAGDTIPVAATVALTTAADIAAAGDAAAGDPAPRRVWQPPLPALLTLSELTRRCPPAADELVVGLLDDPARQHQRMQTITRGRQRGLLVVGGPASGRTNVIALLSAQHPAATSVPADDPERAWDLVHAHVPEPRGLVLLDDADVLLGAYPAEYASVFVLRLEQLVRECAAAGCAVVATAQRATGPLARVGDLLPERIVLRLPTRADHVAAGADASGYDPDAPPGRGMCGPLPLQVARAPHGVVGAAWAVPALRPTARPTAIVARRPAPLRDALGVGRGQAITLLSEAGDTIPGLDAVTAGEGASAAGSGGAVLIGDPDQWQRRWALLAQIRERGELVVDADCAAEFRLVTGIRELPPYARPGAGRGWLCTPDGAVARVDLRAAVT